MHKNYKLDEQGITKIIHSHIKSIEREDTREFYQPSIVYKSRIASESKRVNFRQEESGNSWQPRMILASS